MSTISQSEAVRTFLFALNDELPQIFSHIVPKNHKGFLIFFSEEKGNKKTGYCTCHMPNIYMRVFGIIPHGDSSITLKI